MNLIAIQHLCIVVVTFFKYSLIALHNIITTNSHKGRKVPTNSQNYQQQNKTNETATQ